MNRTPKKSILAVETIIAIVIAIYVLFPFYMVVVNSSKTTTGIINDPVGIVGGSFKQFAQNISDVINNTHFLFWRAFASSLIITVVSVLLLNLFGAMAAWVISRNQSKKWAAVIYFAYIASMIIPFQVVMLPLIATYRDVGKFVGLQLIQSIPGMIFAYLGFGGSMTVFILTGFIKGVPYDLEESASIDGCSPEGTFFRIIFPLLTPVISTVTILNGMWIWNDYLLPTLVIGSNYRTIPIAIQYLRGGYGSIDWGAMMAMLVLAILPIIIFYLCCQKYIIDGVVAGAVKG